MTKTIKFKMAVAQLISEGHWLVETPHGAKRFIAGDYRKIKRQIRRMLRNCRD